MRLSSFVWGLFSYWFGEDLCAPRRCPGESRGRVYLALAELELKDLASSLPWKAYGFFCHKASRLEFACLFLLHPGLIGDIFEVKGRRGREEGDGAEGTYSQKFLRLCVVEWNVADDRRTAKLFSSLSGMSASIMFYHLCLYIHALRYLSRVQLRYLVT